MKVRAAVLENTEASAPYGVSKPLVVQEVDLEGPGRGEVLVKIEAAGICHSDLSVINGDRPRPTPMVLGHEAAGVVVETGAGVDDLEAGDHVIFVFVPSCGHCGPCCEGRPALCEPGALHNTAGELLSGERPFSKNGQPINHHVGVSAFAEYTTVSRRSLVKIDREIPLDIAAVFGCAVLTGAGAVINTAAVKPGQRAAVVGLGGVGLAALLAAVASGAEQIVAVDMQQDKLDFAMKLGATDAFRADDPEVVAKVKEATSGGVDVAAEMAGSAKALELAYAIARRGGTAVTAGLPHPSAMLSIPAISLVAEEKTLRGSYIGSSVPSRDLPRLLGLYGRGRLPVDRLVTHHLKLDEINEGMDRLASGAAIRQIVGFA